MKTVAIFGAGVAGLSAAHEFSRLGYKVLVFETNSIPGGFFRSSRVLDNRIPTEYSWHGMGPWYHNVFDIMKQIPYEENESIYDKGLSRPINFGIAPDNIKKDFDETFIFKKPKAFQMSFFDKIFWAWLLLKTWTANRRTYEFYSSINAAQAWQKFLSKKGANTWKATFGPWIGSDWTNVSLHHAGQFFRKNVMPGAKYFHKSDDQGFAWTHGFTNGGWLLLRGPSNECWFERWVKYLKKNKVEFFFEESLFKFDFDGNKITAAYLESGKKILADIYVLAINPFSAVGILKRTPELLMDKQLNLFEPLTQHGPHVQVSFRIAFEEKILWPVERSAIIISDSEFNLTLFAQEQVWHSDVDLGKNVKSLWTVTACAATVPGRLYGLPITKCSKDQFIEEVLVQLYDCKSLNFLIKKANNDRDLSTFKIDKFELWDEWLFDSIEIKSRQSKWVNTTKTQPFQPTQQTSISNLVIAGAHTKTSADLWSIEAAVESARLAVKIFEPNTKVLKQYKNIFLEIISRIDDIFFQLKLPHILDLLFFCTIIVFLYFGFKNINI